MTLKAKEILGSGPAPKEWEELEGIKDCKPYGDEDFISLQRFDGTDMCSWHVQLQSGMWVERSRKFIVTEE